MAKIVENPEGRRMVRLSAEDVLTVIGLYQQRCYQGGPPQNYREFCSKMTEYPVYLPEDL